jgi:membrane protein DedA with SNARE-associated domain
VRALLIAGLVLKLHHHFHGPPITYAGLAVAAALSWIGVPGPGEPVLIAAGVFAAKHKLDVATVIAVAWMAAMLGGVGGWVVGLKAGRAVVTAPGPLLHLRLGAVERGERIFERYTLLAILLAPTWVAGIHRVSASRFLPLNALAAAMWALGLGLGAYLIGPTVVDLVDDLGLAAGISLAVVIVAVVVVQIVRHRQHARVDVD